MPKILARLQYDVISYIIAVSEEGSHQYLLFINRVDDQVFYTE
jgi:hypothetical protein